MNNKLEITFILFVKKIRELVDGISSRIRVSIKVLDVLEGPAELGKMGLVRFGIKVGSFTKICSVLIITLSCATIVSRSEGQETNECNEEDILFHNKLNK